MFKYLTIIQMEEEKFDSNKHFISGDVVRNIENKSIVGKVDHISNYYDNKKSKTETYTSNFGSRMELPETFD